MAGHELVVDGVEQLEIGQICHEHVHADDVGHAAACRSKDGAEVGQGLAGLRLEIRPGELPRAGHEPELAADVNEAHGAHGLGIGTHGGRGLVRGDELEMVHDTSKKNGPSRAVVKPH